MLPTLLDERSQPDFRETYGALVSRSSRLDVALTHLRLSTLDLTEEEIGQLTRVRLLLAQVSAVALDAEAHAVLHRSDRAENLRRLAALLQSGRIEVRSAPLAAWSPDFSVFCEDEGPFAVIVGPHRFERGGLGGPALASLHGPDGAARTLARFEELWAGAHDISPAVGGILVRAERGAADPLEGAKHQLGQRFPTLGRLAERVDTPLSRR
jgi:hypothetical protein